MYMYKYNTSAVSLYSKAADVEIKELTVPCCYEFHLLIYKQWLIIFTNKVYGRKRSSRLPWLQYVADIVSL